MPRLLDHYREAVVPKMMERFKYRNRMEVPRLVKIVLNMGLGEGSREKDVIEDAVGQLTMLSGQRPVVTRARTSIAAFKLRAGMQVGAKVTLRGPRMYEFLERLVSVAMPRIRDFRGLSRTLDGRGNYNMGLTETTVFPEVNADKVKRVQGLDVTLVSTAASDEEGLEFFELMGVPFKRT
ncbi:MAG: 50S ribosomal protein L5 [Verrucomicrobia bacterium]|nr:50S ribosomal protein L5 [Verrucomicrobiota bacterium]